MKIEQIKTKDLIPYKNNPRINDDAVEYVANSIREFGFKNPILVDDDNVIVAGHTRLKAANKLGIDTVPCIRASDLSEEQIRAYRIIDNKTAEIAKWDFEMLDLELLELEDTFDMGDFGFELTEDKPQEAIEDEFDEIPPEEPVSKLGDLYKLGNHRLMCGDSTSADDVARLMGGVKADMVFTDPPYGVSYADKNKFLNTICRGNRIQEEIQNDHMDISDTAEFIYKAFCNIKECLADYASYYITAPQGGDLMMMMMMMQKAGIPLRHCLIWVKNNHVLGRTDYNYKHEPILYGWADRHKFYGKGKHKFSTWNINKPLKNDLHPTMKPIELIENALLNSSEKNDIVLDLFGGSGSTLIACEQLDRKCYMMEIEPKYCDVIVKRWEQFTGNKAEMINGTPLDLKEFDVKLP